MEGAWLLPRLPQWVDRVVVGPCWVISKVNNWDSWFPWVAVGDSGVSPVDGDEVHHKVPDSPPRAGRRGVKLVGSDTSDDLLYAAQRVATELVNAHARER